MTIQDINHLVELGYHEVEMICKDLLKLPVPQIDRNKPLNLVSSHTTQDLSDGANDPIAEEDALASNDDVDNVDDPAIAAVTQSAARDAAHMSALCEDYEAVLEEAHTAPAIIPLNPPSPDSVPTMQVSVAPAIDLELKSELVHDHGKISIDRMLQVCCKLQSGIITKSKRVMRVNPKFALRRATDITDPQDKDGKVKMTTQEALQRVHVVQALAKDIEKEKKVWEMRWQNFAKCL